MHGVTALTGKLCDILEQAHELLQEAVAGNSDWQNAYEAEDWLVPVGQLQSRALPHEHCSRTTLWVPGALAVTHAG